MAAEYLSAGFTVSATPAAIPRAAAGATAFVGRAVRGPVNCPVLVRSFSEFQQVFGGLWQPSTLSYAVEQFFDHGGRRAVIVRVVNGASAATIKLPAGSEYLTLEAKAPGTREFLRASVDYDHIAPHDTDQFNLVVQRVREPGSSHIDEQEIFRGLSIDPTSPQFVAVAALESNLIRVRGSCPSVRPEQTFMPGTQLSAGYVHANPDGDDGAPLTDYDIIGSSARRSGLFALEGVDEFDFLYIPPLTRTVDIGASVLLVAAQFCQRHRAILLVDPPFAWETPEQAIAGLKSLDFYSEHAALFYPRVVAMDRLRGHSEVFGNGAVVAGLLSRAEEQRPVWSTSAAEPDLVVRSSIRLACELGEAARWRLASAGINTLQRMPSPSEVKPVLRTLAGGKNATADDGYLYSHRFALFVINSVERGTRWLIHARKVRQSWLQAEQQIKDFLHRLLIDGAFPNKSAEEAFFVVCDDRINDAETVRAGAVKLLVHFAPFHAGDYHGYLITHAVQGSSVRRVAVSRAHLNTPLKVMDSVSRNAAVSDSFLTHSKVHVS